MAEKMLKVTEVAERARVDPETVRRWLRGGALRGVRIGPGRGSYRVRSRRLTACSESRRTIRSDRTMEPTSLRHWTHEQANVLARLNIGRDAPWVWISSEGPLTEAAAAPFLQVDGPVGTPSTCPFPYPWSAKWSKKWNGYSVLLVGLLTTIEIHNFRNQYGTFGSSTGVPWWWEEDDRTFAVDLYYQRTKHQDSHLYAEVLSGPSGSDAAIRHANREHREPARKLAWGGMDLLLQGPQPGRPRGPV